MYDDQDCSHFEQTHRDFAEHETPAVHCHSCSQDMEMTKAISHGCQEIGDVPTYFDSPTTLLQ